MFSFFFHCVFKLIISGTPIGVGDIDLYTQYKFIDTPSFPKTKRRFLDEYCDLAKIDLGTRSFTKIVGYRNTDRLHKLVANVTTSFDRQDYTEHQSQDYLCYTQDIPPDLFAKAKQQAQAHYVLTAKTKSFTIDEIQYAKSTAIDPDVLAYRAKVALQLACKHKRAIVFYNYRMEHSLLALAFANYKHVLVRGGMPPLAKAKAVAAMQAGKVNYLIAQIKTINDSLDIQAALTQLFLLILLGRQ